MSVFIHPTAVVHPTASLGHSVTIGPYCVVGEDVQLGDEVNLHAHVVVEGPTVLSRAVQVHPFSVVGAAPQDRTYRAEKTTLFVGTQTVIREHCTVHRGTEKDQGRTSVGSRCLLMVGTHIAHDVVVGDDCTIANGGQLAGHVVLESFVTLGGVVALSPFVRLGEGCFVAAGARVEHAVPPFHVAQGDRARVRALNIVGLRRRNISESSCAALARAHRVLYRSGKSNEQALMELTSEQDPMVQQLTTFLQNYVTVGGRLDANNR